LLKPTDTLYEVTYHFAHHLSDFFFVSPDGARLDGMITLTDLLRAQSNGVKPETPLADFMVKEPTVLAATDSALIAASTLSRTRLQDAARRRGQTDRRIVAWCAFASSSPGCSKWCPRPTGMTAPTLPPG